MYKIKAKNHLESGFTLVELLIAIAIISILSSIAFVMYNEYRKESAKKILISDTKNCLNDCLVKLSNTDEDCQSSDCKTSVFTESCSINLNGPVYVTCIGKGLVANHSCSVYQNGQVQCL